MAKKDRKEPQPEGEKKPRRQKPGSSRVVIDDTTLDAAFSASCEAVAAKAGRERYSIVGNDARKFLVGLPVPSLSIEMLLMCTCWPLGRIFQLVGEEGCGKSTFLHEIARWVLLHGGFVHYCENENKDNAALREAILQYNTHWLTRRIRIDFTASMDEWITVVRNNSAAVIVDNEGLEEDGKETAARRFHWRCPYAYFIDSLMSTSTEKRQDKIEKAGAPQQDYAREAIMLADEARTWTKRLRGTSIIIGGTNHMKPSQDRFGHKVPRAPGGKSIKFMEVLEIHMERHPGNFEKVDRGGYTVNLRTAKNSFAPQHRAIDVNVLWEREETDDPLHPRKRIYWDWHTATSEALVKFMATSPGHRRAIMAACDINLAKEHRLWSDTLGVPEDEPVDYHTFGRLVDFDKEVRQRLRAVIGIEPMNHFRYMTTLAEIYEKANAQADDALDLIYAGTDRDLSGFAAVAAELAGQVAADRRRVAEQRAGEPEPQETFDDVFGRRDDD
jgi:RecA/RadA recombinase